MSAEDLLPLIRSLEGELHDPAVRRNVARLDELLHPQFKEFGRSGRSYTKAGILETLPSQEAGSLRVEAEDFELRVLSPEAVLLTYRSAQVGENGRRELSAWRSSIWTLEPAGWQMIFHQGTPMAGSEGTAADDESR